VDGEKDSVLAVTLLHCKKKVSGFPVPSRDVTYQTLPGRVIIKLLQGPGQGEFGK
jgi:hypothetical protein